jgi:Mg-chelatase subunit ChlD
VTFGDMADDLINPTRLVVRYILPVVVAVWLLPAIAGYISGDLSCDYSLAKNGNLAPPKCFFKRSASELKWVAWFNASAAWSMLADDEQHSLQNYILEAMGQREYPDRESICAAASFLEPLGGLGTTYRNRCAAESADAVRAFVTTANEFLDLWGQPQGGSRNGTSTQIEFTPMDDALLAALPRSELGLVQNVVDNIMTHVNDVCVVQLSAIFGQSLLPPASLPPLVSHSPGRLARYVSVTRLLLQRYPQAMARLVDATGLKLLKRCADAMVATSSPSGRTTTDYSLPDLLVAVVKALPLSCANRTTWDSAESLTLLHRYPIFAAQQAVALLKQRTQQFANDIIVNVTRLWECAVPDELRVGSCGDAAGNASPNSHAGCAANSCDQIAELAKCIDFGPVLVDVSGEDKLMFPVAHAEKFLQAIVSIATSQQLPSAVEAQSSWILRLRVTCSDRTPPPRLLQAIDRSVEASLRRLTPQERRQLAQQLSRDSYGDLVLREHGALLPGGSDRLWLRDTSDMTCEKVVAGLQRSGPASGVTDVAKPEDLVDFCLQFNREITAVGDQIKAAGSPAPVVDRLVDAINGAKTCAARTTADQSASMSERVLLDLMLLHFAQRFHEDSEPAEVARLHPTQVVGLAELLGNRDTHRDPCHPTTPANAPQLPLPQRLVEVLTGQGKSLLFMIGAAYLAAHGETVDVACYSPRLSERDAGDFRAFAARLPAITKRVRYVTLRGVVSALAAQQQWTAATALRRAGIEATSRGFTDVVQVAGSIVLHDEIDMLMSEHIYGRGYDFSVVLNGTHVKRLIREMEADRDSKSGRSVEQFPSYPAAMAECGPFADYAKLSVQALHTALATPRIHQPILRASGGNGSEFLIGYEQSGSDVVDTDAVMPFQTPFDVIELQSAGVVLAASEEDKIGITVKIGQLAYSELVRGQYTRGMAGVTGTLKDMPKATADLAFNLGFERMTFVPSAYQTNVRASLPPVYKERPEEWREAIIAAINDNRAPNQCRAILVFFDSEAAVDDFAKVLRGHPQVSWEPQILRKRDSNAAIDAAVRNAAFPGRVTLLADEFGRGYDFKPIGDTVVLVLKTFFPVSRASQAQIDGRTLRQGKAGAEGSVLQHRELQQLTSTTPTLYQLLWLGKSVAQDALEAVRRHLDEKENAAVAHRVAAARCQEPRHRNTLESLKKVTALSSRGDALTLNTFVASDMAASQLRGHNYVFVLDASGSMYGSDPQWNAVVRTLEQLFAHISRYHRGYSHAVVVFGSSASVSCEWASNSETNLMHACLPKLRGTNNQGSTAYSEGFREASNVLTRHGDDCSMTKFFFLTDGEPNHGNPYVQAIQDLLTAHGPRVSRFVTIGYNAGQLATPALNTVRDTAVQAFRGDSSRAPPTLFPKNADELLHGLLPEIDGGLSY